MTQGAGMARSEVQRRWDEFHRTGMVTVAASPVRCVLMMLGSLVLALFPAVMAAGSFQEHGADSPTGWGCVLATLLFLVTAVLAARPLVRGSRLTLSRHGLAISARRPGERVREMGLRWEEMTHVELHSGSPQSASDDVRIHLASGAGANVEGDVSRGYVDLPDGFAMSKRDLAELLEAIRGFLAARR